MYENNAKLIDYLRSAVSGIKTAVAKLTGKTDALDTRVAALENAGGGGGGGGVTVKSQYVQNVVFNSFATSDPKTAAFYTDVTLSGANLPSSPILWGQVGIAATSNGTIDEANKRCYGHVAVGRSSATSVRLFYLLPPGATYADVPTYFTIYWVE